MKITRSLIKGNLSFVGTVFINSVNFTLTNITGDVNFVGANFSRGEVSFTKAQFKGNTGFSVTEFKGDDANFSESEFSGGEANFLFANFSGGDAHFNGAEFSGGDADFMSAKFSGGSADFGEAQFSRGDVYFGFPFDEVDTDFWAAEFSGYAYFNGVEFSGGNASFRGVKFSGGYADFGDAKFSGNADFLGTDFDQLDVTGSKYNQSLMLEWHRINRPICEDGPLYLAIIKKLKDEELFEDAQDCYYDYRFWRQSTKEIGWSWAMDVLSWLSCGYGVRPSFTILWSMGIMLGFGMAYWAGEGIHRTVRPPAVMRSRRQTIRNMRLK